MSRNPEITTELLNTAVDQYNRKELTRSIWLKEAEMAAIEAPAFAKMDPKERECTIRGFVLALMLPKELLDVFEFKC